MSKGLFSFSTGQFVQKKNILYQNDSFRSFINKQLEDFGRFFEHSDCFGSLSERICASLRTKQSTGGAEKQQNRHVCDEMNEGAFEIKKIICANCPGKYLKRPFDT